MKKPCRHPKYPGRHERMRLTRRDKSKELQPLLKWKFINSRLEEEWERHESQLATYLGMKFEAAEVKKEKTLRRHGVCSCIDTVFHRSTTYVRSKTFTENRALYCSRRQPQLRHAPSSLGEFCVSSHYLASCHGACIPQACSAHQSSSIVSGLITFMSEIPRNPHCKLMTMTTRHSYSTLLLTAAYTASVMR